MVFNSDPLKERFRRSKFVSVASSFVVLSFFLKNVVRGLVHRKRWKELCSRLTRLY